jgi:hypothetical protein
LLFLVACDFKTSDVTQPPYRLAASRKRSGAVREPEVRTEQSPHAEQFRAGGK